MARLSTAERQKQIVDEAIKIIHEKGYPALAIRELARRVGVSEPAIYRHFTNKEEIIAGILNRMAQLGRDLEAEIEKFPTVEEKLSQFILLQMKFLAENPEMTSVIFSEEIFEQNETLRNRLRTVIGQRLNLINKLLDEARAEGQVVEVETKDLSTIIMGYIRLTVQEWRRSHFSFSLEERGKQFLFTLKKIIFRRA